MNSAKALFLALLLSACSRATIAAESVVPPASDPVGDDTIPTAERAPTETMVPVPSLTPEPVVQRTSWLLLGGDHSAHRNGTGYGDKTDVIVLVSVLESDPTEITVVQFPRNLYVPTSLEDQWLFAVWSREGWQGLHQWFQEAMSVSLQGIFYVDMDGFVEIAEELTGVVGMGEDMLTFLRDNEYTWGLGGYDQNERVFQILRVLWSNGQRYFLSDPVAATNIALGLWGEFIQSDLSDVQQIVWVFRLGWKVRSSDYQTQWVQLEEPVIVRGDTPLEVRGMVPAVDLREWMACTLEWSCEDE